MTNNKKKDRKKASIVKKDRKKAYESWLYNNVFAVFLLTLI